MARASRKENINFESSLKRLEEIVRRLEDDQVPLEESLKLFAEGRTLAKACELELKQVENRVRQLTEEPDGTLVEAPFECEAATGAGAEPTGSAEPDLPTGEADEGAAKRDDIPF